MNCRTQLALAVAAGLLFGSLGGNNAGAQSTEAPERGDGRIEEIVVTAQKRAQDLQEVPLAITAVSGEALRRQAAVNTQDLEGIVPNLSIPAESPSGATNGIIFMRGAGTDNTQYTLDPAVGIYFDGVYFARAYGTLFDLFDVDRIEVLRGPQGTLYGRNNSAGALRVFTRPVPLDDLDFSARAAIGRFDERRAAASLGAPIVEDRLGARISLTHRQNDGVQDNRTIRGDSGFSVDFTGINAALLWRAAENADVTLRYMAFLDEGDAIQNVPESDPGPETFESNLRNVNETDNEGLSLSVDWAISDTLEFTSVSAFRTVDLNVAFDLDGIGDPEFEVPFQNIESEYYTQEMYLSGTGAGGSSLNWVAGYFLFDEEIEEQATTAFGPDILFPGQPVLAIPVDRRLETQSYAVYGQADYGITEALSVTGGVRWTSDEKDFTEAFAGLDRSFDDEKVTWRVGLDYRLGDNAMAYGSVSTGFRSGGFDINSGDGFPTEEVVTYEVGTKLRLLDRRLSIDATYFWSEFDDLQQSILSNQNPFGLATTTLDADANGLELQVTLLPVEALQLSAVVGTLDTSVDGLPGFNLKHSPELTYQLGLSYERGLADAGYVVFSTQYKYKDEYFLDPANTPARAIDSTADLTARIAFTTGDERWEFALEGSNLTDEDEPPFRFLFPFQGLSAPLTKFMHAPPSWALTATFRY